MLISKSFQGVGLTKQMRVDSYCFNSTQSSTNRQGIQYGPSVAQKELSKQKIRLLQMVIFGFVVNQVG